LPLGARLVRLVFDFDLLLSQGHTVRGALVALGERPGTYDPQLLQQFTAWQGECMLAVRTRTLPVESMSVDMVLAADILGDAGILLLARGQRVTTRALDMLRDLQASQAVSLMVSVQVAGTDAPDAEAA
jgi:hypothetical protein